MHIARNEHVSVLQPEIHLQCVCLSVCVFIHLYTRVDTTKAKFTYNNHVRHAKQQQQQSTTKQILFTNNLLAAKSLCFASVHTE